MAAQQNVSETAAPHTPEQNADSISDENTSQEQTASESATESANIEPSNPLLPATVGVSAVTINNGDADKQEVNNEAEIEVEVSIETSDDAALKGATIDLELRQTSTGASTTIKATGRSETGTGDTSETNSIGNVTLTVTEPGKPLTARFKVKINEGNKVKGDVRFKAEIKAVTSSDGKTRLDLTNVPATRPPADVVLQPKFREFTLKIK